MSNKNIKTNGNPISNRNESGFTLIEAVFSILILTIGLVGTAAAITYALQYGAISRNVTKAKLMVVASFEEIESLRNSRRLDYKQLANIGGVDNTGVVNTFTGFSVGFGVIPLNPGTDGVYGTADDIADADVAKQGYSRQITITSISPTIKKVQVRVRYPGTGGTTGEITGVCYLNDEARLTR
ncbi:MAG: prepilin-type N-terminal cleavage/methylation domain-containing protein [Pyrinomonadaceae bacterium]